jgi:hypothetical protein
MAKAHMHQCMRCGIDFECQNEGNCSAQYRVLPMIMRAGELVEHCPRYPDWDWIRDLVGRSIDQHAKYRQFDGPLCWKDMPTTSGTVMKCRKQSSHEGECSDHNDCGAKSATGTICGFAPNHAGRHAWELEARDGK